MQRHVADGYLAHFKLASINLDGRETPSPAVLRIFWTILGCSVSVPIHSSLACHHRRNTASDQTEANAL